MGLTRAEDPPRPVLCSFQTRIHRTETAAGEKKHTMKSSVQRKTAIPLVLITLALACVALLPPNAFGVVPPPDGGYPGGNTAEGQNALLSLTTGTFNTAAGWLSLRSNTEGQFNTGIGAGTLLANTAHQNTATGAGALLSNTMGRQKYSRWC